MAGYVIDRDLGWKKIKGEILKMQGSHVKVGVMGDGHLVMYASANEFGANIRHPGGTPFFMIDGEFTPLTNAMKGKAPLTKPHQIVIPERPFMRNAFDNHKGEIMRFIEARENDIMALKMTTETALGLIGEDHKTRVTESINSGNFVANAPSTIKKKGGGKKPLTDSGRLSSSITYEVVIK